MRPKGTVEKALGLLEYFDIENPYWGLSALARKANLSKATTFRLLSSLKKFGLLGLDPETKKYHLGFKLLDLGYRIPERFRLRDVAIRYMERLRDNIKATVYLTEEVNEEGIYSEKVESFSSIRLTPRIGARGPLHAGASFNILMAYLPEKRIDEIIKKVGLPQVTKDTITNEGRLRKELRNIRKKGWAVSHGETHYGISAIAAPIRNATEGVIAGLSMIAPSARLTSKDVKVEDIALLVKDTAKEISQNLGWKYT